MNSLKQVVLLEAIRVTGNNVPYPIVGNWAYLADEIDELVELGFLELNEDKYQISFEGKRVLILFKSERKEILAPCEVYKEVLINDKIMDARLGLMTFRVRKLNDEDALPILNSFAAILHWDIYFENLQQIHNNTALIWQKHLFKSFDKLKNVNRHAWRYLGKNIADATLNCERLLTPLPPKSLIQLTRE